MIIINNKSLTFIVFTLIILGIAACTPKSTTSLQENPEPAQPSEAKKTIVLADISSNPQKKIRRFQPLANYLAANSSQFDLGKVKIAPDMDTLITWLKSDEVDIYIDSPYPAMLAMIGANAKPILRRWKKGQAEYFSLIFTMRDRNVTSVSDLQGKTIAFEDPFSTTGYLLPLAKLLESGLNLVEQNSPISQVSDNAVKYVFSAEDENSIEWLLSGKVAAAAMDNQTFDQLSAEIKEKMIVLAKTEKIARNLVIVRENMSSDEIEAITSILLEMDQTAEGKTVLEKMDLTTKFDKYLISESLDIIHKIYENAHNK